MTRFALTLGWMAATAVGAAAQEFTVAAGDKAPANVPIRRRRRGGGGHQERAGHRHPDRRPQNRPSGPALRPRPARRIAQDPRGHGRQGGPLHPAQARRRTTATFEFHAAGEDGPFGKPGFAWHDTKGESMELRFQDRPVLRYMYKALDESTRQPRATTRSSTTSTTPPACVVTKGRTTGCTRIIGASSTASTR